MYRLLRTRFRRRTSPSSNLHIFAMRAWFKHNDDYPPMPGRVTRNQPGETNRQYADRMRQERGEPAPDHSGRRFVAFDMAAA